MDEINEQTENMKQIQEALSTPIGGAADIDEVSNYLGFVHIIFSPFRSWELVVTLTRRYLGTFLKSSLSLFLAGWPWGRIGGTWRCWIGGATTAASNNTTHKTTCRSELQSSSTSPCTKSPTTKYHGRWWTCSSAGWNGSVRHERIP